MKKALLTVIIAVFLCACLSGCTFTSGIDSLLRPPEFPEEQQKIYNALENYAGQDIDIRYPVSGKNLSAFIMGDLDDDKVSEAVVFYEKRDSGGLRLNILDRNGPRWRSVCDIEADGREVEKVEITKLGSYDKTNIIVGYGLDVNDRFFCVYDYSEGKLSVSFENEPYSFFDTVDLNGNGEKELFAASAQTQSKVASAVIYCPDREGRYKSSAVALDDSYKSIRNVSYSGSGKIQHIFLDADTGSGIVTEVLSVTGSEELYEEFAPDAEENRTKRAGQYLSVDIDGDGNTEIPVPGLCVGYDKKSVDPVYFTSWYTVSGGQLIYKYRSWYDMIAGFDLLIPDSWGDNITARKNAGENTVTLCRGSDPESAEEIFTVKTASEKEPPEEEGYEPLCSGGGKDFFIRINENSGLVRSAGDIKDKLRPAGGAADKTKNK